MNMDLLKGSATNVQRIPNIGKTRALLYTLPNIATSGVEELHEVIASLRGKNVLCATSQQGLWLFYPGSSVEAPGLEAVSRKLDVEGTVQGLDQDETYKTREELLKAIEGNLSFQLGRKHGAVRLGAWSWLLTGADSNSANMLLRVRTHVAASDTLYLTSSAEESKMTGLERGNPGSALVLAPAAVPASLGVGDILEQAGKGQATAAGDRWKAATKAALAAEGIVLEDDAEWIEVLPQGSPNAILWPTTLCYHDSLSRGSSSREDQDLGWKRYFTPAYTPSYTDPLALAESWYTTTAERDRLLAEPPDLVFPAVTDVQIGNNYSPLARHDLQSLGAIYPTPPDGLVATAHPSQHMISSDHAEAAPTELESASKNPTQGQTQQEPAEEDMSAQPESGDHENPRPRNASVASSVGVSRMYQEKQEEDDLFGDGMQGMEFDGDEVGDADFNFFDEPDEVPGGSGDVQPMDLDNALTQDEQKADAGEAAYDTRPVSEERRPAEIPAAEDNAHAAQPDVDPIPDSTDLGEGLLETTQPTTVPDSDPELATLKPEQKPLSPFGIRELLLPPPVPASATTASESDSVSARRQSRFGPLDFKQGLDLDFASRYGVSQSRSKEQAHGADSGSTVMVPPTRGKRKWQDESEESESEVSESEDGGDTDMEHDRTTNGVAKDGADERSSKVALTGALSYSPVRPANSAAAHTRSGSAQVPKAEDLQDQLSKIMDATVIYCDHPHTEQDRQMMKHRQPLAPLSLEGCRHLSPKDLILVAQIAAEQAVTATHSITEELDVLRLDTPTSHYTSSTPVLHTVSQTLYNTFDASKGCDLTSIALPKEPPNRPTANIPKGQPRPPPRNEAGATGPDVNPVPAPFVRVQRGDAGYEVLPTAVGFWEALSLGPASGPKDIQAYCVVPENQDLEDAADMFLDSLKAAYEGARLGSHLHQTLLDPADEDADVEAVATVPVDPDCSLQDALQAYSRVCQELGEALAANAYQDPSRTSVVYMVNPFPKDSRRAAQHLCSAFYSLYTAYRSNLSSSSTKPSDLALQILPIELIASPDSLILPTAAHMALFAREVYDRCPPSASAQTPPSPLPIQAAPAIELAAPLPKRIGFQLAAEPPRDLLNEGSVLHLAYTLSPDKHWVSAAWTDSTGRYQQSAVFCLRGASFAEVAEECWARTLDVLAARECSWRVFITTQELVDEAVSACWREVIQRLTVRKQVVSATLLRFRAGIRLQLSLLPPVCVPAAIADAGTSREAGSGAGFLTPVSTPQTAAFGLSPEGASAGPGTAPPTPASSEVATALESDPDAHLVDVDDETWSVLLDGSVGPVLTSSTKACSSGAAKEIPAQAHGALVKRGAEPDRLPAIGTELLWTVRVRPMRAGIDDGGQRHAEVLLREVLAMWRGLGVLARAKGVGDGLVPVHLVCAEIGAGGLAGLLR